MPIPALTAFPTLLAAGQDDTLGGHHSYELVQALVNHRQQMQDVAAEWANLPKEDTVFGGKASADVANAFIKYIHEHPNVTPATFRSTASSPLPLSGDWVVDAPIGHIDTSRTNPSAFDVKAAMASSNTSVPIYSWAALLRSVSFARTIYAIVWIILGLLMLFFGYASLHWCRNASIARSSSRRTSPRRSEREEDDDDEKASLRSSSKACGSVESHHNKILRLRFLSGGIGGTVVGFLFLSSLTTIIHNAACIDAGRKPVTGQQLFAIWILSGLSGAILAGYFSWLSRGMAGLLAATCLTTTLTAMFGIKTVLVRAILIAVFALLMTGPLLLPRHPLIRMANLMLCTSLIGAVTLLNGVAVVSPARDPTGNWLDLWTLLFMRRNATGHDALTSAWATSVFKGMIAAALLGTLVGFLFQLLLQRKSDHDPDSEWNEYLGAYTKRLEARQYAKGGGNDDDYDAQMNRLAPSSSRVLSRQPQSDLEKAARAGLFEVAPSPWRRMVDFFDSQSAHKPAHYGHLTAAAADEPLDDAYTQQRKRATADTNSLRSKMRQKRARQDGTNVPSKTAARAVSRPARFEPISQRHDKDVNGYEHDYVKYDQWKSRTKDKTDEEDNDSQAGDKSSKGRPEEAAIQRPQSDRKQKR